MFMPVDGKLGGIEDRLAEVVIFFSWFNQCNVFYDMFNSSQLFYYGNGNRKKTANV